MKDTLEFLYQSSQIHFLVNPNDRNVMINATEMAKVFGKRVNVFLKTDHAKAFIKALELTPNGVDSALLKEEDIMSFRGHSGMYFHRILALKFAAWLDPKFELWVFSKIEEITFGNYKKHWDAHAMQEKAKLRMEELKKELLEAPTKDTALQYFEAEKDFISAKQAKANAIRNQNQIRLFE